MIIATVFSPANVLVDPSLPDNVGNLIVNPNGSIKFGTNATMVIGVHGISYSQNASSISCQDATINGVSVSQVPILGWIIGLPILSSIWDSAEAAGAQLVGNKQVATACINDAQNIITINYDGKDIILLFVELIVVVAGATALVGAVTKDAGGTYILFIVGSLASIWIVLSVFAFPTFYTIPNPWGSTLYILVTLGYTIGGIDIVGGGKVL